MEKLKKFLKITATNKMMWITLVVVMLIVIVTPAIIYAINFSKSKSVVADTDIKVAEEKIIKQEDLVDTSKMSEEELQKLNEEEFKKNQEKEKEQEKKKNNTKTTKPAKNKYYIKVNYGAQAVTIYTYDKNGNYTVPVKACVCSTGRYTPKSGVYRLGGKWNWGELIGPVWGQYCSVVVGDILFHSVPYSVRGDKASLISKYYDRLGTKDSLGCIRLTTIDAKWIFDNCPSGTQVEFYSSSNPGPLGKPTAKKVSNAPGKLKNWDPTDPDPRNPWRTYKPEEEKPNENNETKPNNTDVEKPTEPTTPTKPETEKPTEPTTPTKPETEKPTEPTTPTKPETEKPTEPTTPTDPEPEKPTEPTTPTDPETEKPTKPTNQESEKQKANNT